jgi:hypothetical protein
VTTEDRRPDTVERGGKVVVVDPRTSALVADHLRPGASGEEPVLETIGMIAERSLQRLIQPGGEPVDRGEQATYDKLLTVFVHEMLLGCIR